VLGQDYWRQVIVVVGLVSDLDSLDQQTFEVGNDLLKKVFQTQWEQVDILLTQKARQAFPPSARQK
jgi:hypothetical protein